MPVTKPVTKPLWQRALIILSAVVTSALVLGALYWMRSIFVPLALAVFLTAVLAPVVSFLQRRGLGRLPAVVVVVVTAVLLAAGTAAVFVTQLTGLTDTVAENKDSIKTKLGSARTALFGDGESRWGKIMNEWEHSIAPPKEGESTQVVAAVGGTGSVAASVGLPPKEAPQKVVVEPAGSLWSSLDPYAGSVAELLGLVAFALVLMVFMLLAKEDLQDRVFRLLGMGAMTSAARAGGETTFRISRYLFAQFVLNVLFGVVCTVGLFALQVPYALLWGLLATLMRYVPYLGTWIGVILPAGLSAALSNGDQWFLPPDMANGDYWWVQPVGVLVLFLGLELLSNNLIEPRLYGTSLGVSEVALLVMAGFWTFLWGPIGLVLSGPLTMFLVVVGKHTPQFRFLSVLLGSEPPLSPAESLYQRLTSRNQDDAERVVTAAITKDDPRAVFDSTVIPALTMVKQARHDGQMDAEDERQVFVIADEVIDEAVLQVRRLSDEETAEQVGDRKIRVLACPAADEADRLSLDALAGLLPASRWDVKVAAVATLTSEVVQQAAEFNPDVICVAALPPYGVAHVRYLCKRLRARFPDVHIVVGRWGGEVSAEDTAQFVEAGASSVTGSLSSARASLAGWLPVFAAQEEPRGKGESKVPAKVAIGTLPA
jgi:predicted PurR-regulated permease PerM/methylmalonyl-CoA mutase cobalamin-binding subunit